MVRSKPVLSRRHEEKRTKERGDGSGSLYESARTTFFSPFNPISTQRDYQGGPRSELVDCGSYTHSVSVSRLGGSTEVYVLVIYR